MIVSELRGATAWKELFSRSLIRRRLLPDSATPSPRFLLQIIGYTRVLNSDYWVLGSADVWTDLGGVVEDGWSGNLIAGLFCVGYELLSSPSLLLSGECPFESEFFTSIAYVNVE
ncbi:hypothetical protein GIB67_016406 [Kingdonia uniflora]|uniref:Uncharacterized protein n=1 Tax=Kingdonia uniflora TaxID=39325 RepID=A0A7J7MHB0_9MAGN|nr:hypothetical protein GIB67_016406 [Kingdonia uniflora]